MIRNKTTSSPRAPQGASEVAKPAAPAGPAVTTSPAEPVAAPDSGYADARKKLVSISGRQAVVRLPIDAISVKALLAANGYTLAPGALQAGAPATAAAGPAAPTPPQTPAQRARAELTAISAPAASHPRMQHAKDVRDQLAAEGLPTDATGVNVYVVGDSVDHGAMVARTVSGPIGLAPGADLELSGPMPSGGWDKLTAEERTDMNVRTLSVKTGSAGVDELKGWAVDALESAYLAPKAELEYLVQNAPHDGETKIVNMSWGSSEEALVQEATRAAIDSASTSPLVEQCNAQRRASGKPPLDLERSAADRETLRSFIAKEVKSALAEPAARERIKEARAGATKAVADARAAGFLPIVAAGNFFEEGRHEDMNRATTNLVATIPGVLSVGSVDPGDVRVKGDERMGKSSSYGAEVSAPGVDVPVGVKRGTREPKDVSGTSFAAPYVASVAALMVKANPNITPDQLEQILKSDAVATNLKGTMRDGAGVIDPVAAVREAKKLMTAQKPPSRELRDLDPGVQREAHATLRQLMPTTSAAYKAAVRLTTNDAFMALGPKAQVAMLKGLAASPKDAKLPEQLTKLAESRRFRELGPRAQESVAKSFCDPSATEGDRNTLLKLLERPELKGLDVRVKDAVVAAAAKSPADTTLADGLLKQAKDPGIQKLPVEVQAGFFKALEHQVDYATTDVQEAKQQQLNDLVGSAAFGKLDAKSQERWMEALSSPDAQLRDRSFERLKQVVSAGDDLGTAAKALRAPDQVPTTRAPLPGASESEAEIKRGTKKSAAVFFEKSGKGIDPKPRPIEQYLVKIDGHEVEVIFQKPMPAGREFPTVEQIAEGLKALPESERTHVKQVIVDPLFKDGVLQAASAKDGRPNRVFLGSEGPTEPADMAGFLSHETGHLVAADAWTKDPTKLAAWKDAMAADEVTPSNYATASIREDVAEAIALYLQVKGLPEEATFQRQMPGRYALVKELLGEQ